MKTFRYIASGLLISSMVAFSASATPMLYSYQDGETNPFTGWTGEAREASGTVQVSAPTTGTLGSHGNALIVDPPAIPQNTFHYDVFSTDALTQLNYKNMTSYGPSGTQIAGMRFDFYAGANGSGSGAPYNLGFYFQTTAGQVWYYDITTSYVGNGWNTYYVSFDYDASSYAGGGWYGYTDNTWPVNSYGTLGDFSSALTDVSRLGVYIGYQPDNSTQVYGIDNFGLTVPEPETYMVLGMALLTVAFVFRKRITESLAEARTMMQM